MHQKFLSHGTGSGSGAADYVLKDTDHKGEKRESVEVLVGNPEMFAAVADSLEFKQKYSSAVLSFAPTDNPTPEQKREVLRDFADVAFAGLDQDRVCWCAVNHGDKVKGDDIHILIARVDLATGKSLNVAPPGWQKDFDPVRDHHNAKNGWARPDDIALSRSFSPSKMDYQNAKKDLELSDNPKEFLSEFIHAKVQLGLVKDRAGVIKELKKFGEITRKSKNFISIKPDGFKKAVRLKGRAFEKKFNPKLAGQIASGSESDKQVSLRPAPERAERARKGIQEAVKRRSDYNRERFGEGFKKDPEKSQIRTDKNKQGSEEGQSDSKIKMGSALGSGAAAVVGDLPGDVGASPILEKSDHRERPEAGRDQDGDLNKNTEFESDQFNNQRPVPSPSSGDNGAERVPKQKQYKPVGSENSEIGGYMKNSNSELDNFKREIDLGLYLEAKGWTRDNMTSCNTSALYRNDNKEKLLVGKKNEHFLYTNPDIASDKGSIIDFVQKREGLNLGQVRKELRPALNGDFESTHDWKESPEKMEKSQFIWESSKPVKSNAYLEGRGIEKETIEKHSARIRETSSGNLLFGHFGPEGFSGYETKIVEDGKGRFATGLDKSMFTCTNNMSEVTRIVITETAIDSLSYEQKDGLRDDTAYISLAGNPSPDQLEQLKSIASIERIDEVVLAHDKDPGGHKQMAKCEKALEGVDVEITRDQPKNRKDWNAQIQADHPKMRMDAHKTRPSLDFVHKMKSKHYEPDEIEESLSKHLEKGGWHKEGAELYSKVTVAEVFHNLDPEETQEMCCELYDNEIECQLDEAIEAAEVEEVEQAEEVENTEVEEAEEAEAVEVEQFEIEEVEVEQFEIPVESSKKESGGAGKESKAPSSGGGNEGVTDTGEGGGTPQGPSGETAELRRTRQMEAELDAMVAASKSAEKSSSSSSSSPSPKPKKLKKKKKKKI